MYLVEGQADDNSVSGSTHGLSIAAVCWLTNEVRTASYARYLNATLYNIHYLSARHPFYAPFKYIPQCLKTWIVLYKQSPDVIYVMNPPVFAALSVYLYCLVSGKLYVMDTHSPALYGRRWGWTLPLQRALAKYALINIVDQERFLELFASWGAKGIVLERPPLDMARFVDSTSSSREASKDKDGSCCTVETVPGIELLDKQPFHITLIGQFSSDEPVDVVVAAAHQLPDMKFSILGDKAQAPRHLVQSAPPNVIFEGYISGTDYWAHLASVDAVMTLTTFEYSLLGGAQEGMAMGKPLILSSQPVLMDYFSKGTVFVEHNVENMVEGILVAQANATRLGREITELAREKRESWNASFAEFQQILEQAAGQK